MISVRHYERFSLPYMKQMVDEIHRLGHQAIIIYFGGIADRLEQLAAIGADGLAMETSMKGYVNDIDAIAQTIGQRMTLFGNVDPVGCLQDAGDAALEAEVRRQAQPVAAPAASSCVPAAPSRRIRPLPACANSSGWAKPSGDYGPSVSGEEGCVNADVATPPKRRFKLRMAQREALVFYLLIFPWIFGFLAFQVGPLVASLGFSLTDYDVVHTPTFLGLQNYRTMFFDDKLFWQALKVTFTYAFMAIPLGICFALFLAVLLNQKIPGLAIFRTVFYLPSVIAGVAVSLLWLWLFNPNLGLINHLLRSVLASRARPGCLTRRRSSPPTSS